MSWDEHLMTLIAKAAEQHQIVDYVVQCNDQYSNGNNLFGDIKPVNIKGKNKTLHLLLKVAPTDELLRSKRAILEAFEREAYVYEMVLPALMKFQDAYNISNPFSATAKCYGTSRLPKNEAILMDNLSFQGYERWPPKTLIDFSHMRLVLQEYAKLHVISLAMKHKNPSEFDAIIYNMRMDFLEEGEGNNPEHYKHLMEVMLDMGSKAVKGNLKAEECYGSFRKIFPQYWQTRKSNLQLAVVSHGDCHPDNLLFKEDQVCLIDWQLSSLQSPINDVSFVMFACASKEALEASEDLLKVYYDLVEQNLKDFNMEEVFSYDTFRSLWRQHCLYGLYRAQMTLKLALMDQEDVAAGSSVLDRLKADFSAQSLFAQRMRDLYEIVSSKNWII